MAESALNLPISSHVVGSGMIAQAYQKNLNSFKNSCIYAAGVSNSGCRDQSEFDRERARLIESLQQHDPSQLFVYFGTCSVYDREARYTDYVNHKLAMESLVTQCSRYLIFRLPQVVGVTPNPHTLMNYLYARVSRSEAFTVWTKAFRNIVDVDDVVSITREIFDRGGFENRIINIANQRTYSMQEILETLQLVTDKTAIYTTVERGGRYDIDISEIREIIEKLKIDFNDQYLQKVIAKYYLPSEPATI